MANVSGLLSPRSAQFVFKLVGQIQTCPSLGFGSAMVRAARQIQKAPPQGHATCFDALPGNLKYFHEITAGEPGISLFEKSVGNFDGLGVFIATDMAPSREKQWGNRVSYSSTDMLISGAAAAGKPNGNVFCVDVCSLDNPAYRRPPKLKINAPGYGRAVILGVARRLVAERPWLLGHNCSRTQRRGERRRLFRSERLRVLPRQARCETVGVKAIGLGFCASDKEIALSIGATAVRGEIEELAARYERHQPFHGRLAPPKRVFLERHSSHAQRVRQPFQPGA